MTYRVCLAAVVVFIATGCGGSDSTPTPAAAPSPTTSVINVTLATPIRMGATAQATGTAVLSNGENQPITTGWLSDAPNVATVTTGGLVTGVANGLATIYVISGGRQGQQTARVVPDYQGSWSGRTAVTSCTQTGTFTTVDFCSTFSAGSTSPYSLSLAQSGLSMTARLSYGATLNSVPTSTSILTDGTSSFLATMVGSSGIIINATVAINSLSVGALTGTINEVWTLPGVPGEARLAQNIVGTTRTSATAPLSVGGSIGDGGRSEKLHMLDRLVSPRP